MSKWRSYDCGVEMQTMHHVSFACSSWSWQWSRLKGIVRVTELSFVVADSRSVLFDASILLVMLVLVQRAKRVMYKNSTFFIHPSINTLFSYSLWCGVNMWIVCLSPWLLQPSVWYGVKNEPSWSRNPSPNVSYYCWYVEFSENVTSLERRAATPCRNPVWILLTKNGL